jgi:uncharacterized protein (DUF1330 family)
MLTAMKSLLGATLAIVIYGSGCGALYAQSKAPKAYWVTETLQVTDQAGFLSVIKRVPPIVKAHGGRYIVLGGKIVPGVGSPPSRITIIAFESLEAAQGWYNDPAAVAAREEVKKYGKVRDYTVEGIAD